MKQALSTRTMAAAFAGLLAVGIATQASARDRDGLYFGATYGHTFFDIDDDPLGGAFGISESDFSFDDDDDAWGIFGGYMINQYVGFELGFIDLGRIQSKFSSGSSGRSTFSDVEAKAKGDIWGINFGVRGQYPIPGVEDHLSLIGGVGGLYYDASFDTRIGAVGDGGFVEESFSEDESGVAGTVSAGFQLDLCDAAALRAEYQRIFEMDIPGEGIGADQILGSIVFRMDPISDFFGD